jgi:2-phospho-L-lactate guanylyltransferase
VLPVKRRSAAKQRLAGVLSLEERAGLMEAMLADVVDALATVRGLAGVMLVSGDAGFRAFGRARGLRVLDDPVDRGTAAAVSMAAAGLAREGASSLLVIHADLPLATSAAIEAVLATAAGGPTLSLVPDAGRRGTNALLATPIDLVPFCFGEDSFRRHRDAALAAGVRAAVLDLPDLAHDIDRPGDLAALAGRRGATAAWYDRSGIADRVMPAAVEAVR